MIRRLLLMATTAGVMLLSASAASANHICVDAPFGYTYCIVT